MLRDPSVLPFCWWFNVDCLQHLLRFRGMLTMSTRSQRTGVNWQLFFYLYYVLCICLYKYTVNTCAYIVLVFRHLYVSICLYCIYMYMYTEWKCICLYCIMIFQEIDGGSPNDSLRSLANLDDEAQLSGLKLRDVRQAVIEKERGECFTSRLQFIDYQNRT